MNKEIILKAINETATVRAAARLVGVNDMKLRYWMKKHSVLPKKTYTPTESKTKHCPRCKTEKNKEDFFKNRNTLSSYCKKCMYEFNAENRRVFKIKCVEYKGGKCIKCNYNNSMSALEFHHRNPDEKDFQLSGSQLNKQCNLSDKIKKELDKCDLMCSNCHREEHEKINGII
jgi:hypothetical protein